MPLLLLLTNTHAHTKKLDDDEDDDDFDDARFSKRHHLLPTVVLVASKATKKRSSSIQSRRRLARDDDDDDERVDVFCRKRRGGDDTRRQRPRDDDDDARQRIVKGVVYGVKGVDKLAIRPVVSKDGGVFVFPGTHDSGAYFLTNTFQPGKQSPVPDWVKSVSKVAKTVGIPIEELLRPPRKNIAEFEQLGGGRRYLDLRCGWQGRGGGGGGGDKQGTWKIHHALVGVDVSIVLEDVANFLRTFTTEVVIVEMSHFFYGDPDERAVEQLASEVLGSLGEFVVPYEKDENGDTFWTKPLEDSVKKNQRVLIAFENFNMYNTSDKYKPFLWPWVLENGYADTDDVATMKEYNYDVVRAFNNNTQTEGTNKEKENEEEEEARDGFNKALVDSHRASENG